MIAAEGLRLLVAAVLLIAAVAKMLGGIRRFEREIASFGVVPVRASRPIAIGLPFIEGCVGATLAADVLRPLPELTAAALLVGFALVVALAVRRRHTGACGCFGLWTETVRWRLAYRNLALAAALVPTQLLGETASAAATAVLVSSGALAVAGLRSGVISVGQELRAEGIR